MKTAYSNHKYRVCIYLPVYPAFGDFGPDGKTHKSLEDFAAKALKEINSANIKINHCTQKIGTDIAVIPHNIDISVERKNIKHHKNERGAKYSDFLVFSATLDLSSYANYYKNKESGYRAAWTEEAFIESIYRYECAQIYKKISLFFVATQIAKPGSLVTDEGLIYINDTFHTKMSAIKHYLNIDLYDEFPLAKELSISQTWNWVLKQNGYFNELSKNKIERALNAFTHLFHESYNFNLGVDLMYSLLGLEALYNDNAENIMHQFVTKSSILINTPPDYLKKIKKMYGYRSRLFHGQMNFPSNFSSGSEESSDYVKHSNEFWSACTLAKKMLLSSLQELIIQNARDIKYEFKLSLTDSEFN